MKINSIDPLANEHGQRAIRFIYRYSWLKLGLFSIVPFYYYVENLTYIRSGGIGGAIASGILELYLFFFCPLFVLVAFALPRLRQLKAWTYIVVIFYTCLTSIAFWWELLDGLNSILVDGGLTLRLSIYMLIVFSLIIIDIITFSHFVHLYLLYFPPESKA